MSEKKLFLIGAGDFGREIMYSALEQDVSSTGAKWKPIAFIEKDSKKIGTTVEGINVISLKEARKIADENTYFMTALGFPTMREDSIKAFLESIPHAKFATVIHRSAVIMPTARIEEGVYIGPHATVAIGCHIQTHAVLNFNVSIGHDCIVGAYSVVSPGCLLSGRSEIGKNTFLGSGVITYPCVKIGDNCAVSAGVTVPRSITDSKKLIPKPNTMTIPMGNTRE